MKRKNQKIQIIMLIVISVFAIYGISDLYVDYSLTANKEYLENATAITQLPGTYTSTDGKTITVASDGTTKYLDTYTLTVAEAATGNVLSGKVGTNNKTATLYQLNDHIIVSAATVNYTHNSATEYLYDYTVFSLQKAPETSATGIIEVWRNNQKVNSYNTLQAAVDSAVSGDTIKINKDFTTSEGTYINKNITIEGNNHTIDTSKWLNSLMVIDKNIDVTIKNLIIEGGATGFKINYEGVTFTNATIPLVANSAANDPKNNLSAILNKGNLAITNSQINNIYGTTGAAINHIEGNLTLNNSEFNHNRGSNGGAIYLGRTFYAGETNYPSQTTTINNYIFSDNYSSNGGALFLRNNETLNIKNSEFNKNTVTGGKGGAIYIYRDKPAGYNSTAEKLGLDFMMVNIDNSVFYGNWVGDDGSSIQSFDGQLTIRKTKFIENVGTHPSSAIGTVSSQVSRNNANSNNIIEECLFENNKGATPGLGDHSSKANYHISKTKFTGNKGKYTILFYSSQSTISDSIFTGEKNEITQIILSSYENPPMEPTLTVTNTIFENNATPTDIMVTKDGAKLSRADYTLNIKGETTANIQAWYECNVNIDGKINGYVEADSTVNENDIKVLENSIITKGIHFHTNEVRVTTVLTDENNNITNHYMYVEPNRVYTEKELFLKHNIGKPNGKIVFYEDNKYTKPWTYTTSANVRIYARIEEHTHTSDNSMIVLNNVIYDQCECGYLNKKLSLSVPKNNSYTGKEIPISVTNTINAKDYKVVYYTKDNNDWKEINTIPIEAGNYKAVLTYNNLEISQEYSILEPPKVEEPEKEEPKEEDKKEEESKEEDKTEENIPPILEEEKEETPKEEPKDENNPFTSNNASKIFALSAALISSISLCVMYIIQNKKIQKNI